MSNVPGYASPGHVPDIYKRPDNAPHTKMHDDTAVALDLFGDTINVVTSVDGSRKFKLVADNAGTGLQLVPLDGGGGAIVVPNPPESTTTNTTVDGTADVGTGTNQLNYVGDWHPADTTGGTGTPTSGFEKYCTTAGDYVEMAFVGTDITVYGSTESGFGKQDVLIDGVTSGSPLDAYSSGTVRGVSRFTHSGMSNGPHTIRITQRADKNGSSSGLGFTVESAVVGVTTTTGGGDTVYDPQGVSISSAAVSPSTGDTDDTFSGSYTLHVNRTVVFQDACIAVRAVVGAVEDAHLDFAHLTAPATVTDSLTLTSTRQFTTPGTYKYYLAYNVAGVWQRGPDIGTVTISAATPTSPSGTSPIGVRGFRSGLAWASGMFGLNRHGNPGAAASYEAAEVAYETGRGRLGDVSQAAAWNDSWAALEGLEVLDFMSTTRVCCVSLPPWVTGGRWDAAAAGTYDTHYQAMGATIVTKRPSKKTIIRPGWEGNGTWYEWRADATGGLPAYIAGFRRMVEQMRIGAEAHLTGSSALIVVSWSLSALDPYFGDPLATQYPGDTWVDIIGVDSYDNNGKTTSATVPGHADIYQRVYDFAKSHGKWMAFDEWGLHNTGQSGEGGDNPLHIKAMFAWFRGHKDILAYEEYFQDTLPGNVQNALFDVVNRNPLGTAAYLAEMANAANT